VSSGSAGQGTGNGSMGLLTLGRRFLAATPALPGEVELYLERSRTTSIKVYAREVESLVTGAPSGVGVRYVHEGRQGYAYTADLGDEAFRRTLYRAVANAEATDSDPHVTLPEPARSYPDVPGLWRPGVGSTSMERKIALAMEAEAVALAAEEIETVEESTYADGESQVALLSSLGVEVEGEQTVCYCYLSAHARRGEDVQTALGYTTGREPEELEAEAAGAEAALKARRLLGAAPCASGSYTVVLDREVAAAVLGVISRALSAEAVQKGRSLFAGKEGELVGAAQLCLVDNGVHPEGMDSSAFDDEGVPRGQTDLIRDGVLAGYLYDTYTANRAGEGRRSTGNAARGSYRSAPGVSSSNLVLEAGQGSLEELFTRVRKGLYVLSVTGLHSGANPVSGEFSVGAVGHLIENGSLGPPVREITIASDLLSMLRNVSDRAGDQRWIPFHGSVLTPAIAIGEIAVSGT